MADRYFRTFVSDCQPYSIRRTNLTLEEFAITTILEAESWGSTDSPPGVIYFLSLGDLSSRLGVGQDPLRETLEKLKKVKEIRVNLRKGTRSEIIFLNWDKKQHPHLSQVKYKERKRAERTKTQQAGKAIAGDNPAIAGDKPDMTFGREKEKEREKDIKEGIVNMEDGNGGSSKRASFFSLLKSFSASSPYPFSEEEDSKVFDPFFERYPGIDFAAQLRKKIDFWKSNPGALASRGKGPRVQLFEFLVGEIDYQNRDMTES